MTIRERYHVAAGELCGRLAGKLLKRLALHALAIDDDLTFYRVKDVLALGVRQGWHPDDPTRHVRPNRGRRGAGAREWPEPVLGSPEAWCGKHGVHLPHMWSERGPSYRCSGLKW